MRSEVFVLAGSEKPAWLYYVTLTILLVRVLLVLLLPPVAGPSESLVRRLPIESFCWMLLFYSRCCKFHMIVSTYKIIFLFLLPLL